jgi:hypothetical protein
MREEKTQVLGKLHRCKICGALWRLNPPSSVQPDGSWTLVSEKCGKCCDNVEMGSQIEPVPAGHYLRVGEVSSKPLVYIAGPFRAPTPWGVECNVREAEAAVAAMIEASAGMVVPIAPHMLFRYFDKLAPDTYFLEATLALLRKCDALYLLPGWERSSGTRGELQEANRLGLIVSEYMTDILSRLGVAAAKLSGVRDG